MEYRELPKHIGHRNPESDKYIASKRDEDLDNVLIIVWEGVVQ
jgi:hypothetical protein